MPCFASESRTNDFGVARPLIKKCFVPVCSSEYQEGYAHCAECGVALVSGPAAAEKSPGANGREARAANMLWRGQDPVAFRRFSARWPTPQFRIVKRKAATTRLASRSLSRSALGLPHWQILVHPSDLERSANPIAEDALSPIPAGPVELEARKWGGDPRRRHASPHVGKRRRRFASGRPRTLRRDIISAISCWKTMSRAGRFPVPQARFACWCSGKMKRVRENPRRRVAKEGAA